MKDVKCTLVWPSTFDLTYSPDALCLFPFFPTKHSLVPWPKQVPDLCTLRVVHITIDHTLLGSPIACLNTQKHSSVYASVYPLPTGSYLHKCEFAGANIFIRDGHFPILVHPPLTSEHIVDARGHFLPLVMIIMPKNTDKLHCIFWCTYFWSTCPPSIRTLLTAPLSPRVQTVWGHFEQNIFFRVRSYCGD